MQLPKAPDLMQITVIEKLLLPELLEAAGTELKDIAMAIWILPDGPTDNLHDNLIKLRQLVRVNLDIYENESDPEAAAELLGTIHRCLEQGQCVSLIDIMRLEMLEELYSFITNQETFEYGLLPIIKKWIRVSRTL